MQHDLILTSALIAMASGIPAAFLSRKSDIAQCLSTMILVAANLLGLFAVSRWWAFGAAEPLSFPAPMMGFDVSLAIDGISAFFLIPILLVTSLASIYGLQYWRPSEHESAARLAFFFGLMTGSMTLLVVAQDGLLFLAAWELMAVSAMFQVAAEDHLVETRKAAWLYMAASHFATLCLFGVFAILFAINGEWDFGVLKETGTPLAGALALLAFVGFGTKAGLMPLHIWLPSAHAQAPSHVSAVMSGVLIKMGVYGLVRVSTFFPSVPLSWGLFVLLMGTVSAVLGVTFAVSQRDIKRLLAYSSIENVGIMVMGLGLALIGQRLQQPVWEVLGICGAMLHLWNHALFKSLLFLAAGSVVHGVGTRDMDVMGGLSKRMPWTANCFLVGAVAICGLPPLNGFVSEFFIYLGLFGTIAPVHGAIANAAAFTVPALALVGALAVACFVKVYGIVFFGAARSHAAMQAHEAGPAMLIPMVLLASCCIAIGIAPGLVAPCLDALVASWGTETIGALRIADVAPLSAISVLAVVLAFLLTVGVGWLLRRGIRHAPRGLTWDCGYAAPSARMQYTSSSFAETLVKLSRGVLQPKVQLPNTAGLFPSDTPFESRVDDTVLELGVWPLTRGVTWLFSWGRFLQGGSMQAYLMYILIVIVFLLLWN